MDLATLEFAKCKQGLVFAANFFPCISGSHTQLGIPLIHYQNPATLHGSGLLRKIGQLFIGVIGPLMLYRFLPRLQYPGHPEEISLPTTNRPDWLNPSRCCWQSLFFNDVQAFLLLFWRFMKKMAPL